MKHQPTTSPISFSALIGFICVCALVVAAKTGSSTPTQTSSPNPTQTGSPSPSPDTAPSPAPNGLPQVIRVLEGHLELDDIIRIEVDNLSSWADTNDPTKLVPYLNGRAIRGNYPEEIHATKNHLQFHLQITPENKDVWVDLLGEPSATRRPVAFSVGLENQSPFDSVFGLNNNPLTLTVISPVYGVVSLVVVLLTAVLLIGLARKTNLIRKPGGSPVPGKLAPYDLGRAQMAFWFFLIYASYLTIWLITDALDTITPALLGLMGISAGTALGEAMIDAGKDDAQSAQLQQLTGEKQSLEPSIPELQSQVAEMNAKTTLTPEDTTNRDSLNQQLQDNRTRLAQVNQQIQTLTPAASSYVSSGFLNDILADASGYSFHRFQIFAWTIVLGIIFVSSVYNTLTMPEFSPTLLGLMGLSSGTYLGFKFPEQK